MFSHLNFFAAIVAATLAFVLGGFWYCPKLFGAVWCKENNSDMNEGHGKHVYLIAFIYYIISSLAFSYYLGANVDLMSAIKSGLIIGALFVTPAFAINYIFTGRNVKLLIIDGCYHTAQFVLYGVIFGLWH